MRFSEPWLLVLAIPVLIGLVLSVRALSGMTRGRKIVALVVRTVLALLLIGILAEPESFRANRGTCTIFVLDRSDSISGTEAQRSEEFIRESSKSMGPEDQFAIVVFGRDPVIDTAPSGRTTLRPILSKVDGGASDLASALRLAVATFPEGKARRIVALTDGNETLGDALEPTQVYAQDGVSVDVVSLGDQKGQAEVAVLDLETPSESRAGQRFELKAIVQSTLDTKATVELDRNGQLISQMTVDLNKGRNSVLIPQTLEVAGLQRYRVRIVAADDRDVRNNVGLGFVQVRGKPSLLLMQDDTNKTELAKALARTGLQVDLRGPGSMPARPEQYQRYDGVIFSDFNAQNLMPAQMKMLQGAVRDGGVGFAMIGGENSFLPGGYYGTPIADMLPVDLNIRQRKSFPSTAVAILVDCSGSMSMVEDGVQKLDMAIRAAEETVKLLAPFDRVAVAGSSDGIEWVAPMQPLTDKMAVVSQIRKLEVTGGGIYIGPTVARAETVMRADDSKVKHIIILADGADSTDFQDAFAKTSAMRGDKITTTVVAIGDGSDVPALRQLARAGGGNFYLARRASQLPAIFTQDTAIMSRSAIEEGTFVPKMIGVDEIMRGITATPALHAYCLSDSRPLARVVLKTAKDDPLLAKWQYGLGTSIAFTSDAQARWARDWIGWEGFDAFWGQFARSLARKVTENQYQVSVDNQGGKGRISVKGTDTLGNPLSGQDLAVRVLTPAGASQEMRLRTTAPGEFEGSFKTEETGAYIVSVAEPGPDGKPLVSTSGFAVAYPPEYRVSGPNQPLINRIAAAGSGRVLKAPFEAFRTLANTGGSVQEIWPLLLWAACLLLLLDIAVRRLVFTWSLAGMVAFVKRRERPLTAAQTNAPRLSAAKNRVAAPKGEKLAVPVESKSPRPTPAPPAKKGPAAATSLLEAKRQRKRDEDELGPR